MVPNVSWRPLEVSTGKKDLKKDLKKDFSE